LSSFKKFWNYKSLSIEDVDVKFLKKYEKWMLETRGNSITTVGIYLRNLRTVFNIIINHDKSKYENYPFTEKKYIIPTSENEKISLELSDLKKLFEYQGDPETVEKKYLDIWKLIFLMNGINVADLLQLKWSDINGDEFKYNRTKTKRTNRKLKFIRGVINDEAKRILKDWGTNPNLKSEYIFNVLENDDTEVRKKSKIKNFTKCINKSMKKVGVKLGFTEKMTTYVARHSFMSKLFNETSNILVIKEVAGHSSVLTSERYLKTLKSVELKETLKNIANF
jgi:integrase/recombinase XerD